MDVIVQIKLTLKVSGPAKGDVFAASETPPITVEVENTVAIAMKVCIPCKDVSFESITMLDVLFELRV